MKPLVRLSQQNLKTQAVEAQIRASVAVVVESCSLEDGDFVSVDVAGSRYFVPPKAYATHPRTGETKTWDGLLRIVDVRGVSTNPDDKESVLATARNPLAKRDVLAIRAYEVASKIVEFRQDRGVFQHSGDDEQDARMRQLATEQWLAWRRNEAQKVVMTYHKRQENARNVPGAFVQPMDDFQLKSQNFIEAINDPEGPYERYKTALGGHKLKCKEQPSDGYTATDDEAGIEKFTRHLRVTHKMSPEDIERNYMTDDEDERAAEAVAAQAAEDRPARARPRARR